MRTIVAILSLIMFFAMSNAQNLNGKWKGIINGPGGDMELLYTFTVQGNSLSGSVTSMMGTLQLENGKIDGNKLSFSININGQSFSNTGVVNGDTIKLYAPMMDEPLVLKRVTEPKIDGKWLGKISGPQGDFDITFTFKVEGDKLTGKNSTVMGENELKNCVLNGNEFSFDVDAGGMIINHKCKYLDDDTIEMKVDFMGQDMVMKLTRVSQ